MFFFCIGTVSYRNVYFHRDSRVNELEASVNQTKEDVLRLQSERTDLIAKVCTTLHLSILVIII